MSISEKQSSKTKYNKNFKQLLSKASVVVDDSNVVAEDSSKSKLETMFQETLQVTITKDHHIEDIKLRKQHLDNETQNTVIRRKYAGKIFCLVSCYLVFVAILLSVTILQTKEQRLDSSVVIALLTTTTATVLGLFVIVANYFFKETRDKNLS